MKGAKGFSAKEFVYRGARSADAAQALASLVGSWYNVGMRKSIRILKGMAIALLSVTWCALQTFVGAVLFLVLLPQSSIGRYRGTISVYHKAKFSVSFGVFCFISDRAEGARNVRSHLYGHFLQSCCFGPFYLFTVVLSQLIVRIPSVRRRRAERGKSVDDTFFERNAAFFSEKAGE